MTEKSKIDPVCIIHGKKRSEHECLYCCLCFAALTLDKCSLNKGGEKQDVCIDCAKKEKVYEKYRRNQKQ